MLTRIKLTAGNLLTPTTLRLTVILTTLILAALAGGAPNDMGRMGG